MGPNSNRRRHGVVVAIALLCLIAAPVASAAWRPAEPLSPVSQTVMSAQVTANAEGDSAAAWSAFNQGLQVSLRPAGGAWDVAPAQLSTPGTQVASYPVVLDADGNATAVWSQYTVSGGFPPTPGPVTIYTARRPAGGSWGAAEQLSTSPAGYTPALGVGAGGHVAALWVEGANIKSATRTATGAWGAAETLPSTGGTNVPLVAVGADGAITAAWQNSTTTNVVSAVRPAGGAWSAPVDVSGATGVGPALAMSDAGDATLVWQPDSTGELSARRATAGGGWGAPVPISVAGDVYYYTPVVALDAHGRATAAWAQAVAGPPLRYEQNVASRAADGTWSAPVALSTGTSDTMAVAADAVGDVTVAWRGESVAQTASHAPGAAWSAVTDIPDFGTGSGTTVAVDGEGDAVFAAAPSARVFAVTDDIAGPQLRGLTVPATAVAGATASFGVSPFDVWSALGTTTWNFGDGATATGSAASHQYATAGVKTVTVTATDAFGNATAGSSALTVTGGATPTGPGQTPAGPAAPTVCVSNRIVTLHWKLSPRQNARSVALSVTGRTTRKLSRTARAATVDFRGAAAGTYHVTVRTRTTRGGLVTIARTYRTCIPAG
jgi:hypothetical protein